jgi:hypothetical protein
VQGVKTGGGFIQDVPSSGEVFYNAPFDEDDATWLVVGVNWADPDNPEIPADGALQSSKGVVRKTVLRGRKSWPPPRAIGGELRIRCSTCGIFGSTPRFTAQLGQ